MADADTGRLVEELADFASQRMCAEVKEHSNPRWVKLEEYKACVRELLLRFFDELTSDRRFAAALAEYRDGSAAMAGAALTELVLDHYDSSDYLQENDAVFYSDGCHPCPDDIPGILEEAVQTLMD